MMMRLLVLRGIANRAGEDFEAELDHDLAIRMDIVSGSTGYETKSRGIDLAVCAMHLRKGVLVISYRVTWSDQDTPIV